jgi:hypothetical protein
MAAMSRLVRAPRAGQGPIEQDFAFCGNSAPNKLRFFHDHGRATVSAATIQTKRAGLCPSGPGAMAAARLGYDPGREVVLGACGGMGAT